MTLIARDLGERTAAVVQRGRVSRAERCRELESVQVESPNADLDEVERLEARAAASASASVQGFQVQQTELLQIIILKHCPYSEYCRKLHRIADSSRLAVALRKFFPSLGSGLGVPGTGGQDWGKRYWRCDSERADVKTDAFRLVKALDDLPLGRSRKSTPNFGRLGRTRHEHAMV